MSLTHAYTRKGERPTMSQSPSASVPDWSRATHLSETECHRILSSERRRETLRVLRGEPGTLALESLASSVAERVAGTEPADPDTIERTAIGLHHNDLPKLADAGVVDYDPASGLVEASIDRFPFEG